MSRAEDGSTEAILAECIEAFEEGGDSAVRAIVERHPDRRDRLQRRLELLGRVGFGPRADTDRPPTLADGRFQVERELGRGGMGVVWLVQDQELGRRVALKTGPNSLVAGDRARERFEREVHAVSRLAHPRLVPILDVGRDGDTPWYTMEFVEGATLAQALTWVRQLGLAPEMLDASHLRDCVAPEGAVSGDAWGRTWIETVCRIVIDVALGLEHVHANGIVHRDVKPSNVLVDAGARGRLFDLGLAHVVDEPGITRTGDLAGTPHYVAPEQVDDAQAVDARTDVYSLGVTLYELLTLRRPFEGRTTQEILRRIQNAEPAPPRRHHPQLPRELETICLTALEKEPARRYACAADMAADLERFLSFRPIHARPAGWRRRSWKFIRRRPAQAALLGLALLVAVGTPIGLITANAAIRRQRDRAERTAVEARVEAENTRAVLAFLTDLVLAAVTEDGKPPITAGELLQLGATRAAAHYVDRPLLQASLFEAIGRTYANLDRPEAAIPMLDRSLALRERELGRTHLQVARVLHTLARAHLAGGDLEAAQALAERALRSLPELGSARAEAAADTEVTLGDIAFARHDLAGARRAFENALAARRALDEESSETLATAEVLTRLGDVLVEEGELDAAERILEEGHAIRRNLLGRVDLPDLASSLESLARLNERRGRSDDARVTLEEALGLYRKAYGSTDPAVARVLEGLARLAPGAERRPSSSAAGAVVPESRPVLDPELGFRDLRPARFFEASQAGITALQAARDERAVGAFEECLELVPHSPTAAYNLACALGRAGRVEDGLDALERALALGQDDTGDRYELILKDPDLDPLRARPRFAGIAARWRASCDALHEYQAQAASYVPETLRGREAWPLVIVVHAESETKEAIMQGEWRRLAGEFGFALLAPSGRVSLGEHPRDGLTWIRTLESFEQRAWEYEEPINRALETFRQEHPVDREAIYLVGEGVGAMVAFDVALQSPGLFKGVLLEQGTLHPTLGLDHVGRLAALGTRVDLRVDPTRPVAGLSLAASAERLVEEVAAILAAHDIRGGARLVTPEDLEDGDARATVAQWLGR
jgi:serine/threonine protein kinase/tetratricopeptide (TPR) repeat protein